MRRCVAGSHNSGQALIEHVLTLPLLLLAVVGIFDFGRAILYYNTLAEAAREGARYAMVHGANSATPSGPGSGSYTAPNRDTAVEAAVKRFGIGLDHSQMTILATWPDGDNKAGHRVSVEVDYAYVPLTTMILGKVSVPLRSTSVTTILY